MDTHSITVIKNKNRECLQTKIIFVLLCICMAIPSGIYVLKGKTIFDLKANFSFFINSSTEGLTLPKIVGTILFFTIWILITVIYFYFIKNYTKIFKTKKSTITMLIIVAFIFTLILPMTSTDVFYYIGTGWEEANYGKNPYYTSVDELMLQNENAANDEILLKMQGTWSHQTVVYGPIWPIVCKILSYLSFGNLGIALMNYKIFNFIIHLLNCYFVYKITGNNKKYMIMYGLNPLVLFEGLTNVHNEILVVFFILIALYFVLNKKKIIPAIVFLACATAVKYFAVLLAPFFVIYYYQKENLQKKILYSVCLAIMFLLIEVLFYSFYMTDFSMLKGIFVQQSKYANSIILFVSIINFSLAQSISKGIMIAFAIIYIAKIIELLTLKRQFTFDEYIKNYNSLLLMFIFVVMTNFQPWYVIWIMPTIFWQGKQRIETLLIITSTIEFTNIIYFLFGDSYVIGQFYMFAFIIILASVLIINNKENN